MKQTLFTLLNTYGGVGREDAVRETIAELARPYCDEMRTDALGNLICVRAGKEGGRRVMVAAHMDHIGFVVLDADEHGFLRVHNAGGISKRASLNRHVVFANGVNGVVSNETERFSADDNKMSDLFIDIGAKDRADALSMVALGDVAVYAPDAFELANGMIAAPAVDDRVGCAIALEAMKELGECENEVAFVFTVQEELGLRGARAAAYGVDPQIGVALDVTLSGDTPKGPKIAVKAGEGPCVKVRDSSLVCSPRVVRGLEEAAGRVGVKTQREVLSAGGNDAGAMQAARAGVLAGTISIACRYVHSACETISLADCEGAKSMLVEFLRQSGEKTVFVDFLGALIAGKSGIIVDFLYRWAKSSWWTIRWYSTKIGTKYFRHEEKWL